MRGGDVVRSPLVILSEAKDLLLICEQQILRFAQDDKCLACCLTIALLALPATARAQIAGAHYCASDVFNDKPPIEGANVIERMHPVDRTPAFDWRVVVEDVARAILRAGDLRSSRRRQRQ